MSMHAVIDHLKLTFEKLFEFVYLSECFQKLDFVECTYFNVIHAFFYIVRKG